MFEIIRNSRFLQFYSAIAATTAISAISCYLTWPSPALPQLTSENSPIGQTLNKEEGSWIASIVLLASLPASLSAAWFCKTIGRKGTLLLSFIPTFFPWFVVMYAESFWTLLIARAVAGIGVGLSTATSAIYNGEIADPDIRGKISSIFNLMKLMGDLLVLTAGPYVSYKELAILCAAMAVLFLLMFFWVPESPYHLVQKGRMEDARAALVRFNSASADSSMIDKKLADIQNTVQSTIEQKTSYWEFLSSPEYRRIIFIIWGVKTLQMMSGTIAMDGYLQTIIEASDSSLSPELSSIVFGVVQIPAALVATYLVDRLGRKPLLITSASIAAVALIAEGMYFFLQDYMESDIVDSLSWLPTTALALYIVMKPIGLQSLPYVLLGEVFPNNIKGVAVSLATVYGASLGFITMKVFDPVSEAWGRYTMLWFFGAICVLGALFVLKFVPETKGKTFDEIQLKINRKFKK